MMVAISARLPRHLRIACDFRRLGSVGDRGQNHRWNSSTPATSGLLHSRKATRSSLARGGRWRDFRSKPNAAPVKTVNASRRFARVDRSTRTALAKRLPQARSPNSKTAGLILSPAVQTIWERNSEHSGSSHLRLILVNYDATSRRCRHDRNMHASTRFDHLFFDFAARFVPRSEPRFPRGVTNWIRRRPSVSRRCFPRRSNVVTVPSVDVVVVVVSLVPSDRIVLVDFVVVELICANASGAISAQAGVMLVFFIISFPFVLPCLKDSAARLRFTDGSRQWVP